MISVLSTTLHADRRVFGDVRPDQLDRRAGAANCAPLMVVVTYLPSPPVSVAMLVMTSGSSSASSVMALPAAGPEKPSHQHVVDARLRRRDQRGQVGRQRRRYRSRRTARWWAPRRGGRRAC